MIVTDSAKKKAHIVPEMHPFRFCLCTNQFLLVAVCMFAVFDLHSSVWLLFGVAVWHLIWTANRKIENPEPDESQENILWMWMGLFSCVYPFSSLPTHPAEIKVLKKQTNAHPTHFRSELCGEWDIL